MIGVFDSGAGGLTVLGELRRRLPSADFLYVGDTARAPYGRKPAAAVTRFAGEIADFLCHRGAEAIVVACGTASAVALEDLRQRCPVPVWGVIDASVAAATHATRTGSVGVIATAAAITSGAYQSRLHAHGLKVWARACPMLVHVAEEGLADSAEAALLARHYLADRPEMDTLILGCTHYPILRAAIQRAAGPGVRLVDGAADVASEVSAALTGAARGSGHVLYYVTGDAEAFRHTARKMRRDEVLALEHADWRPGETRVPRWLGSRVFPELRPVTDPMS